MNQPFRLLLLAATLTLQACAFGNATLPVAVSPGANFKGPLSQLGPATFDVQGLADQRSDTARIGYKKNGFGQKTADILTARPVQDIVAEALHAGLAKNGHKVSREATAINVAGAVKRFWFEFDPNMFTVQFIGVVEAELTFADARTGAQIYKSLYSGTYSETTGGGLEKTWTSVMGKAVDKLVEDVVFDEELVEALQAHAG